MIADELCRNKASIVEIYITAIGVHFPLTWKTYEDNISCNVDGIFCAQLQFMKLLSSAQRKLYTHI